MSITGNDCVIRWIVIYQLDITIQLLSDWGQINHYSVDKYRETICSIQWIVIYPVDSVIHHFEQLVRGPGCSKDGKCYPSDKC